MDDLQQIAIAKTPEEAATLLRAQALKTCAGLGQVWDAATLLANVRKAEQDAQTLERGYEGSNGEPIEKPWRQWLKDWGYPVRFPCEATYCEAEKGHDGAHEFKLRGPASGSVPETLLASKLATAELVIEEQRKAIALLREQLLIEPVAGKLSGATAVDLADELCGRGYNVKLTKPRKPGAGPQVTSMRMTRGPR